MKQALEKQTYGYRNNVNLVIFSLGKHHSSLDDHGNDILDRFVLIMKFVKK